MKFGHRLKDIALLYVFLLSYVVVRFAIIALLCYLYPVIKMKTAKPEPVPTTSFEYYRSYLVYFVRSSTFNLRKHAFSGYANLTFPEFGNFGYSWDC